MQVEGWIAEYQQDGGFGRIAQREGPACYFRVHAVNCPPQFIEVGLLVRFDVVEQARGPMAVNVKILWDEKRENHGR